MLVCQMVYKRDGGEKGAAGRPEMEEEEEEGAYIIPCSISRRRWPTLIELYIDIQYSGLLQRVMLLHA
jgi:hypothetical protein